MDSTTPSPDAVDSPLTDPGALLDATDIRSTAIVREQDDSHFETRDEDAGFAIVGITNDNDEVLLSGTEDGVFWRLPHARIAPGADYVEAAVDSVHTHLGPEVAIDRIAQVRQFDAVLEESQAAVDADAIEFDGEPEVWWFDNVPDGAPGGLPGENLRLFCD